MNLSTKTTPTEKKPFSFDLSFDDGLNDNTPQILTNGEIKALKASAFEEGKTQGAANAQETMTAAVKALLETLHFDLDTLKQNVARYNDALSADAVGLVRHIIEKIAPFAVTSTFFQEVEKLLTDHMAQHQPTHLLTLTIHPSLVDPFMDFLNSSHPALLESLTVEGNDTCAVGNYTLRWGTGYLTKHQATLSEAVETLLQQRMKELRSDNPFVQEAESSKTQEHPSEENGPTEPLQAETTHNNQHQEQE